MGYHVVGWLPVDKNLLVGQYLKKVDIYKYI